MERARIITLGNATPMAATSFEEAFGEYSEARGRGRARRQKRKMERINNRKTRRTARQQGRLEKKRSRVEARTQRRTMRADNREQRRAQKSEGKRMRERADLEQEREFAPEEAPEEAPQGGGGGGGGYAPEEAPQGGGYDDGGYAAPQGGGYDDGGYAAPQGGGYDDGGYAAPQDEGGYAEEGGYEEEGGYAEEDGGYDESDGFDGESYDFDGADEMIDAPYSPQVNQNVMDAAKRIEWNLEMASRLKDKGNSPKVSDAVCQCENRVAELKSTLDGYCNFDGEFESDASGKMRFRKRKGLNSQEKRRRNKEMRTAKMMARKERNSMRKKNGLTPVQGELNPRIGMNKIVIPAKELGSNATGIIGLDDAGDYDASATEIKLGIEGTPTSKIPFKAIAIGLAVGVLAIVVLRKYKIV
jgi:TolA-binding protein